MKKLLTGLLILFPLVAVAAPTARATTNYRLKTMFTGSNKCLDIINDSQDNKPIMANCGNYSGQFWQIPNF